VLQGFLSIPQCVHNQVCARSEPDSTRRPNPSPSRPLSPSFHTASALCEGDDEPGPKWSFVERHENGRCQQAGPGPGRA
jgi:hypothetical protein